MDNNRPTFSVVIPVYNGEKYIQNAVKSCLTQTVVPDEIIVIDDASTDDTELQIKQIRSDRIVYIRNGQNKGASFCRNIGIQSARYSWILFLDADDTFHPQKVEIIRYCLLRNEQIKAIGHSFQLPGETLFQPDEFWKNSIAPKQLSTKQVLISSPMVTPSLAISASNGLSFDETMFYAEDHDFILRTSEKYDLWYLDMPLCILGRIPLSSGGMSGNRWQMRKGEINMYIRYCKRNHHRAAIPFFILFSLLKHARTVLLQRTKS